MIIKIWYIPNYSHLVGIMISKTIGSLGTQHFQTHPQQCHNVTTAVWSRWGSLMAPWRQVVQSLTVASKASLLVLVVLVVALVPCVICVFHNLPCVPFVNSKPRNWLEHDISSIYFNLFRSFSKCSWHYQSFKMTHVRYFRNLPRSWHDWRRLWWLWIWGVIARHWELRPEFVSKVVSISFPLILPRQRFGLGWFGPQLVTDYETIISDCDTQKDHCCHDMPRMPRWRFGQCGTPRKSPRIRTAHLTKCAWEIVFTEQNALGSQDCWGTKTWPQKINLKKVQRKCWLFRGYWYQNTAAVMIKDWNEQTMASAKKTFGRVWAESFQVLRASRNVLMPLFGADDVFVRKVRKRSSKLLLAWAEKFPWFNGFLGQVFPCFPSSPQSQNLRFCCTLGLSWFVEAHVFFQGKCLTGQVTQKLLRLVLSSWLRNQSCRCD